MKKIAENENENEDSDGVQAPSKKMHMFCKSPSMHSSGRLDIPQDKLAEFKNELKRMDDSRQSKRVQDDVC